MINGSCRDEDVRLPDLEAKFTGQVGGSLNLLRRDKTYI
jgi:hypothetical protein